jgi:hypothetical protein
MIYLIFINSFAQCLYLSFLSVSGDAIGKQSGPRNQSCKQLLDTQRADQRKYKVHVIPLIISLTREKRIKACNFVRC